MTFIYPFYSYRQHKNNFNDYDSIIEKRKQVIENFKENSNYDKNKHVVLHNKEELSEEFIKFSNEEALRSLYSKWNIKY